ncbi:spermatogenesis-associated protein 22-like [Stegodyphus dumicola]|uniref:spermatogenesis-associated protein 22-like n=1 Tax=Stegodyphus dumicola TaxID=202533 RepID=UPI0015AAA4AA|nr:spermatogenesis-associated protein 22-like [Stegodyphus dumicola]
MVAGPNNVANKPTSFTFRNNVASRMRNHIPPATPALGGNYRMSANLRTPVLTNMWEQNTHPYEAGQSGYIGMEPAAQKTPLLPNQRGSKSNIYETTPSYNNSYSTSMEVVDHDNWGMEDVFGNENFMNPNEEYWPNDTNMFPVQPHRIQNNNSFNIQDLPCENRNDKTNKAQKTHMRQTVLSSDSLKGLAFKLEKSKKRKNTVLSENCQRIFPRWNTLPSAESLNNKLDGEDYSFPRMFTVTVEKLLAWPQILSGRKAIFELYGILEKISQTSLLSAKNICLKTQKVRISMTCTFYEIDRPLPKLVIGQWQR